MHFHKFGLAAVVAVTLAGNCWPAVARPLTPAEQRYAHWQAVLPLCSSGDVADIIQTRFAEREGAYWNSGLSITGFRNIREIGFRSNGADYIPRRYCSADAVMNNRKTRRVIYSIGEDLGMTGTDIVGSLTQSLTLGLAISHSNVSMNVNVGVDWCVVGLDRNAAYGLNCKAARP